MALVPAEPVPPQVSASALHDALVVTFGDDAGDRFYQWLAVDHPTWARGVARRLESTRVDCAAMEGR